MDSTPLTSCSIGVATDCSTASAEAPGYVAVTRMFGGARNGYCSIESPRMTTTPIKSVRIELTIATIGRLIKKLAMSGSASLHLRRFSCRRINLAARSHFLHSFYDYAVAGVQAVEHYDFFVRFVSELDAAHGDH